MGRKTLPRQELPRRRVKAVLLLAGVRLAVGDHDMSGREELTSYRRIYLVQAR